MANSTEFSLTEPQIKNIQSLLSQKTYEEIKKQDYKIWPKLRQSALQFLSFYTEFKNANTESENQYYAIQKQTYSSALDFQEKLDEFRDNQKTRKGLFVFEAANGELSTYEMSLKDLFKSFEPGGRIWTINRNDYQKKEDKIDKKHLEVAQAAYNGAVNRLDRYYEVYGGNKQGGLLKWKNGRHWEVGRVQNKGDLKEAYANFLVQKHETQSDVLCSLGETGVPPYYSHELIKNFFNSYINQVGNAGALKEEDVQAEKVQYAVKSKGSSLFGLEQYKNVALQVINKKDISKQDVEDLLNQKKEAFRNIIIKKANQTWKTAQKDMGLEELQKMNVIRGIKYK